ncbi:MAG: signal peptidase II [Deltaproteobacteria bacterium]|nr:signal peptidase II [Deltaproteobacteria bacterium]
MCAPDAQAYYPGCPDRGFINNEFGTMDHYRKLSLITFGVIATVIVFADQLTKYLVSSSIPLNGSETIIPGFLNLVHVRNTGAAFGTFSHSGNVVIRIALSGISLIALIIIGWLVFFQRLDRYSVIGFALFFGGAAGNFIDRLILGHVTDFIDVYVKDVHWPAFNVADSALTIGALIFCVRLLFQEQVKS